MTDQQLNPDGPDIPDPDHGLPGPAVPLPDGDAEQAEPTSVNDYDDEED